MPGWHYATIRGDNSAMLKNLLGQITAAFVTGEDEPPIDRETAIRRATVILMIDVALADRDFTEPERARITELVRTHFDLDDAAASELITGLQTDAEDLTSVHTFTSVLHRHLDHDEKAAIIAMLWQIACADGELDMHEDALVRKIGDLLYVSRGRVMQLRHAALGDD